GLAGGLAAEAEDELALGAGAVAAEEEAPVGLLEHLLGAFVAQAVAMQAPGPVSVVQGDEEQGLAVVGPGHLAVAVVERQFAQQARVQFPDEQPVDLVAAGVQ